MGQKIKSWLLKKFNSVGTNDLGQLYICRNKKETVILIAARVTDDILLPGSIREMRIFSTASSESFLAIKFIVDNHINFNRFNITLNVAGDVTMDSRPFLQKITPIPIDNGKKGHE